MTYSKIYNTTINDSNNLTTRVIIDSLLIISITAVLLNIDIAKLKGGISKGFTAYGSFYEQPLTKKTRTKPLKNRYKKKQKPTPINNEKVNIFEDFSFTYETYILSSK